LFGQVLSYAGSQTTGGKEDKKGDSSKRKWVNKEGVFLKRKQSFDCLLNQRALSVAAAGLGADRKTMKNGVRSY